MLNLHEMMTEAELHHYFGTVDASGVDYEVIQHTAPNRIAKRSGKSDHSLQHTFSAFGESYNLNLIPTPSLITGRTVVAKRSAGGILTPLGSKNDLDCHYQHSGSGEDMAAAISHCGGETHGMVYTKSHVLELLPLNERLSARVTDTTNTSSYHTVVTKRSLASVHDRHKAIFNVDSLHQAVQKRAESTKAWGRPMKKYTELAVFVDFWADRNLNDFFGDNGEV